MRCRQAAAGCRWVLPLLSRLPSARALHDGYLASRERRPCSLAVCQASPGSSGRSRPREANAACATSRVFPGFGDYYPGPAAVVIEPERSAVGHRLLDGRDDLRKQVVVGKIDLFCAFPSRPGDPPIRCRCHTGTVSRIGELEDSQLGLWLPLGSTLGGSPDLRITRCHRGLLAGSNPALAWCFQARGKRAKGHRCLSCQAACSTAGRQYQVSLRRPGS